MGYGVKTGGRDFKKGHGGKGRPKEDPDLRAAKAMTKLEFVRLLVQFLEMPLSELEALLHKDTVGGRKVLEVWVGRLCLLGIKEGDFKRLDFMADRLFGKSKGSTPQVEMNFTGVPRDQIIELSRQAIAFLEEGSSDVVDV